MFICLNCHREISDSPIGSKQRNHCPFCLWSMHLDDKIPGDRKSNCHDLMQPIGLTSKLIPINHIARHTTGKQSEHLRNEIGELMIVHYCNKCGIFSKNRIAGDDDTLQLLKLLSNVEYMPPWPLLTISDENEVRNQLFGVSVNS